MSYNCRVARENHAASLGESLMAQIRLPHSPCQGKSRRGTARGTDGYDGAGSIRKERRSPGRGRAANAGRFGVTQRECLALTTKKRPGPALLKPDLQLESSRPQSFLTKISMGRPLLIFVIPLRQLRPVLRGVREPGGRPARTSSRTSGAGDRGPPHLRAQNLACKESKIRSKEIRQLPLGKCPVSFVAFFRLLLTLAIRSLHELYAAPQEPWLWVQPPHG